MKLWLTVRRRQLADWAGHPDTWIAAGVFLASVLLLAATSDQGFVRDEGYYFRAARDYHRWFEELWRNIGDGVELSFTDAALRRGFGFNTEHPGLVKIAMGFTWKIFHAWLGWVGHADGYRLASMLLVCVGNAFTYLLGARFFSRPVGMLGVLFLLASPHVFYHAHLACFDGPIMGLTVLVTYAFWRSLRSRAWVIGVGLAWGVALAAKHNATFLPVTLAVAYAGARACDFRLVRGALRLPDLPFAFIAMALLGPLVFFLFYPYGWHDPIQRIGDYYGYHLHHEHYPVEYFGTLQVAPPFPLHFPFVMSGVTIPLVILACGTLGLAVMLGRIVVSLWRARTVTSVTDEIGPWLLVTATLVPPMLIALPTVPIFGGTKHWITMMPFFCLLAAWVVWNAAQLAFERLDRTRWVAAAALVVVAVLLPVIETARSHPLGHTYFNELAGGHQGGAALGMSRTFWGGDGRGLLDRLNREAVKGARVFTDRMNQDDFMAYQRDGLLRADLLWVIDLRRANWALINHQREYRDNEYEVWSLTGRRQPIAVLQPDGVAIASLYHVRD